jgi:(+)-pinoresinol hydroxylase
MRKITQVGLAVALALSAAGISAQDAAELERGKEVFDNWCAACHTGNRPGSVALEVRYQGVRPAHLEDREDLVPELTRFFVRNGISIMPPFRKTEITDEELEALAAYLAPRD